ncbi:hypothetical protein Csa_017509 [Cucumis sativus]|nr:hypothetical protein Csa_017509 [Cucumis sativus]
MDGVKILASDFQEDEKVEIGKLVSAMGGVLHTKASLDVSFVIAKNTLAAKYKWALNISKKPIVSFSWLQQCWIEHCVVPQEGYRVLPFSGLNISVSGIPAEKIVFLYFFLFMVLLGTSDEIVLVPSFLGLRTTIEIVEEKHIKAYGGMTAINLSSSTLGATSKGDEIIALSKFISVSIEKRALNGWALNGRKNGFANGRPVNTIFAGEGFRLWRGEEEIKLERGKGLAKRREAKAELMELELEKDRPLARSR